MSKPRETLASKLAAAYEKISALESEITLNVSHIHHAFDLDATDARYIRDVLKAERERAEPYHYGLLDSLIDALEG